MNALEKRIVDLLDQEFSVIFDASYDDGVMVILSRHGVSTTKLIDSQSWLGDAQDRNTVLADTLLVLQHQVEERLRDREWLKDSKYLDAKRGND